MQKKEVARVFFKLGIESITNLKTVLILAASFVFISGLKKSNTMITVLTGSILGWGLSYH